MASQIISRPIVKEAVRQKLRIMIAQSATIGCISQRKYTIGKRIRQIQMRICLIFLDI